MRTAPPPGPRWSATQSIARDASISDPRQTIGSKPAVSRDRNGADRGPSRTIVSRWPPLWLVAASPEPEPVAAEAAPPPDPEPPRTLADLGLVETSPGVWTAPGFERIEFGRPPQ